MIYKKGNLILPEEGEITFHFDGGTPAMRDRFRLHLQFYSFTYNYKFEELTTDADMKIRFSDECNSKAWVGKEGREARKNKTFNINIQKSRWNFKNYDSFDYVCTHEIGHWIGLNHSHMQPNVYDFILDELPDGWVEELERFKSDDYIKTPWFKGDVMSYYIHCYMVASGHDDCNFAVRHQTHRFIFEFRKILGVDTNLPSLEFDQFLKELESHSDVKRFRRFRNLIGKG